MLMKGCVNLRQEKLGALATCWMELAGIMTIFVFWFIHFLRKKYSKKRMRGQSIVRAHSVIKISMAVSLIDMN